MRLSSSSMILCGKLTCRSAYSVQNSMFSPACSFSKKSRNEARPNECFKMWQSCARLFKTRNSNSANASELDPNIVWKLSLSILNRIDFFDEVTVALRKLLSLFTRAISPKYCPGFRVPSLLVDFVSGSDSFSLSLSSCSVFVVTCTLPCTMI
ncbi:hypothetical protein ACHAW6_010096 [Cyclotella cf. meneghiniana]